MVCECEREREKCNLILAVANNYVHVQFRYGRAW